MELVFKIDDTIVPDPVIGNTSVGKEIIGPSTRTIDGSMLSITVDQMYKFIWDYPALPIAEYERLEALIDAKTETVGLNVNSFAITHNDGVKDIVVQCYLGNSRVATPVASWDGKTQVVATQYHWIQLYGKVGEIITE